MTLARGATIGYVPQEPSLDETKTVRENVEIGAEKVRKLLEEYNAVTESLATELSEKDMQEAYDRLAELQEKIDGYLSSNTRLELQALVFKNFQEVFEIDEEIILSQRQLDDISYDLEIKALQFQKEFSSEEDKLKILGLNAAKLFNLEVPKDKQ